MSNHDAEVLMTPFHTYTIQGQSMYNMHVWLYVSMVMDLMACCSIGSH